MSTGLHANLVGEDIHSPYRKVFANAAARLADSTVYLESDLYKTAFQVDTTQVYYLSSYDPTVWLPLLNSASPNGVTIESHKALRDIIHFLDEGPGDGFASGAFKEVVGGFFPTSITWYTSEDKTEKIYEMLINREGGGASLVAPTPITFKMYEGNTIIATIIDTITYDGVVEINRTRTVV